MPVRCRRLFERGNIASVSHRVAHIELIQQFCSEGVCLTNKHQEDERNLGDHGDAAGVSLLVSLKNKASRVHQLDENQKMLIWILRR